MKYIKRLAVIVVCISALLSLFGCKKEKDPFILDGPSMINPYAWDSFDITRSGDSIAEHNFHIIVKYSNDGYVVTGTVNGYSEEEGILLETSDCERIDALDAGYLPDYEEVAADGSVEPELPLDAPEVTIQVAHLNGTLAKKVDKDGFSLKVYEIVKPYFEEKYNKN